MSSLRIRLLLAMLLVMSGFWIVWSCAYVVHMTQEQSGWLDHSLRDIAHQILASLPEDIALLPSGSRLSVPGDVETGTEKMSFQVWALPDTPILRSLESPQSPLRPDLRVGFSVEEIGGRKWRVYAASDAGGRIQVQTGKPMDVLKDNFWKWSRIALLVALLIFVTLGVTLWKVIGWSVKPLTRLQENMAKREEYDLAPLSTASLPDEVRPLVESFNRLMLRIDRAIGNERQFIADAAHELRTPMAAVQAQAQVALQSTDPEETRAALERLIAAVQRGTRLAQQLLDSARLESGHGNRHQDLDLAELVSLVTHEVEGIARQRRQTISLKARPCTVRGDTDELGILVGNLLDNALRYSGEGSRIEVDCRSQPDGGAVLQISDNGPGVPDESERSRVFDRFFRAGGNGERGSGIGLSLVRRIAASHGAHIDIGDGLEAKGLGFRIQFPAIPGQADTDPHRLANQLDG